MSNFITEPGRYGAQVTVIGEWDTQVAEYIKENNIKELYLNDARGWRGEDISFLKDISHLEVFSILDWTIDDITPIHNLHELRSLELEVSTYCKAEIDFSQFPHLEECFLEWRPKAKSLFECATLKKLFLNSYKGQDCSKFKNLNNLESLSIANSSVKNIRDLKTLEKLNFLGLYNLRGLVSLEGIENLIGLEKLEVTGCRKFTSLKEIANLKNLRRLELCDNGTIDSLKLLDGLTELQEVFFTGSTNVLDGDLDGLKKLKKLAKISFQNRKHYSCKREDFKGYK